MKKTYVFVSILVAFVMFLAALRSRCKNSHPYRDQVSCNPDSGFCGSPYRDSSTAHRHHGTKSDAHPVGCCR